MNHHHGHHVTLGPLRRTPTHEEIAFAAYFIWQADGRKPGHDERNWRWGEQQLKVAQLPGK